MMLILLSLPSYDDSVRSKMTSSGSGKTAVRCLPVAVTPVPFEHKPEGVDSTAPGREQQRVSKMI